MIISFEKIREIIIIYNQKKSNKYSKYLLLFFNMISHQISIFTRKIFFLDLSNSIFSQ